MTLIIGGGEFSIHLNNLLQVGAQGDNLIYSLLTLHHMPRLTLEGKEIEYELVLRNVRYVRISVLPDGRLKVVSPMANVEPVLLKKRRWILKRLALIEEARREGFPYFGEFLDKPPAVGRELEELLRRELRETVLPLVVKRSADFNVSPGRIYIRRVRSRWGSASFRGNLSFSLALAALPLEIIDYVVTHEVAHLRHMNHSRAFWSLVESVHPDWREKRKELKKWWVIVSLNDAWRELLTPGENPPL